MMLKKIEYIFHLMLFIKVKGLTFFSDKEVI